MPVVKLSSFNVNQVTNMDVPDTITSPLNPNKVDFPEVIIWGDRVFVGNLGGYHEALSYTIPTHGGQGGTGTTSAPREGENNAQNKPHRMDGVV
jgi:hypothetical protein